MIAFVALLAAVVAALRLWRQHRFGGGAADRVRLPPTPLVALLIGGAVVAALTGPGLFLWQKIIGRMVLPLGALWSVTWLVAAWRLADPVRPRRRSPVGALLLATALTILGSEPLGQVAMWWLERDFQTDPFSVPPTDAVLVLGGGADRAPDGHYELGPAGDRVALGARLYRRGLATTLITTGTAIADFHTSFDSTIATRTLWRDLGVDDDAIVAVDHTRNTREEASQVAALARRRGWRRVGVVSSAWHLRRAMALFHRAAPDIAWVPLAADHRGLPGWEGLYSLVPVGSGAWLQQKAAWEILGAAAGR